METESIASVAGKNSAEMMATIEEQNSNIENITAIMKEIEQSSENLTDMIPDVKVA